MTNSMREAMAQQTRWAAYGYDWPAQQARKAAHLAQLLAEPDAHQRFEMHRAYLWAEHRQALASGIPEAELHHPDFLLRMDAEGDLIFG